jgi:hypothetical protein
LQKCPAVTEPVTSLLPTICALVPSTWSALLDSLSSRLAWVLAGKLNVPMPARVASVSLTVTPLPRVLA